MRKKVFIAAIVIAAFLLPLESNAKGKPDSVVLLKDANGVEIGRVIGMGTASWPYVLTDQGYRTLFRVGTGMIFNEDPVPVYYVSGDCTGHAYVGKRYPGTVFTPGQIDLLAYTMGAILYSPNDAQSVIINTNSTFDSDLNCIAWVSSREAYPAYPNDPDITGIQNTAYPTRMLIE